MTGGNCPICGKGEAHEHIISNALPPGEHPTYEELLSDIENFKRWNVEMKESLIAILTCASTGGPSDVPFDLGLIRIECRRVLGHPGAQAVDKLSDTFGSTDDILESLRDYMNKHTNATGTGPCCPPGRCKEEYADSMKCSRWTQALAPEEK
jgi:hypothetical protein